MGDFIGAVLAILLYLVFWALLVLAFAGINYWVLNDIFPQFGYADWIALTGTFGATVSVFAKVGSHD